jgi:hypothetical protein
VTIRIQTGGIQNALQFVRALPDAIDKAKLPAVNTTTRFAYAESSRGIREQVSFARTYLGSPTSGNRLKVTKWATPRSAEAVIEGRKRATSLARFATDRSLGRRRNGVSVQVAPGRRKQIPGAFLIKLRSGASLNEDQYNIGLAFRLRPGNVVRNKRRMVQYSTRVRSGRKKADTSIYLLYGPSVDQVFRDVAVRVEPRVSDKLESEFLRQLSRFASGR